MSAGISAAAWVGLGSAALGAVGGSKGGGGGGSTQMQIDPRFAKYIYGEDDKGGLLADADALYQKNKGGLNPQMVQGLNTQWNVFNDPANMAGYRQMSNLGSGLMSAPVMGNPFSDGRATLGGGGPRPGGLLGYLDAQQPAGGQGLLAHAPAPKSYGPDYGNSGAAFGGSPGTGGPFTMPPAPAPAAAAPPPAPAADPNDPNAIDPVTGLPRWYQWMQFSGETAGP